MPGWSQFAAIGWLAFTLSYQAFGAPDLAIRADTYIAVSYSPHDGSWGWGRANNLETAQVIARGYCKENTCQSIFWARNACVVLAAGSDLSYGWGWSTDRLTALQIALQNCSDLSFGCKVMINECT